MLSKTLIVWPMLHFPIYLADYDQGTIQFHTFCQSKKSSKFSFRYITFYYFKDFLKISIMDNRVWPISSFQKNDQTAFELRCTSQNFYHRLYVLNHIVLPCIFYTSFCEKLYSFLYFHQKLYFFLYLHHFK